MNLCTDLKLTAEAEQRLEKLQDKLHDLQQQDRQDLEAVPATADTGRLTAESMICRLLEPSLRSLVMLTAS